MARPVESLVPGSRRTGWQVCAGRGDLAAIPWDRLDEYAGAELVKQNPVRQVWRVQAGTEVWFAKRFTDFGIAHAIRRILRGAPEKKEWQVSEYAERHGVPCVRFAGLLKPEGGRGRARAVLVSPEVPNVVSLADAWRGCHTAGGPALRKRTGDRLAELVVRLMADGHARRFLHRDTHPHNILIRQDEDGVPLQAIFADVQKARIGRRITDADAAANLAELAHWFVYWTTATERMRFLRAYLALRHGWDAGHARSFKARPVRRRFLRRIEAAFGAQVVDLYMKRDRRIFGTNRYFARADLGRGWHGTFTLRFRWRGQRPASSQPDRSLAEWGAWVRREFPHLECEARCDDAAARLGLVLLREKAPTLWRQGVWTLFKCPNRTSFGMFHRERHRDLPAPVPVALFERRRFGLIVESVLLLEAGET